MDWELFGAIATPLVLYMIFQIIFWVDYFKDYAAKMSRMVFLSCLLPWGYIILSPYWISRALGMLILRTPGAISRFIEWTSDTYENLED